MSAVRLDTYLAESGQVASRSRAAALIRSGKVRVNGEVVEKPSFPVSSQDTVSSEDDLPYVSRGGLKLAAALDHFDLDVTGKLCLDVGASTGGFTDCLLQRGAERVWAIDVGHGQLVSSLKDDPRVHWEEGTNARYLKPNHWDTAFQFVCVDVSFISLTCVLPAVLPQTGDSSADLVCLVKPQFELFPEALDRRGVVKSEELRARAVEKIRNFLIDCQGWKVFDPMDSPVAGIKGNLEYLIHARKS